MSLGRSILQRVILRIDLCGSRSQVVVQRNELVHVEAQPIKDTYPALHSDHGAFPDFSPVRSSALQW